MGQNRNLRPRKLRTKHDQTPRGRHYLGEDQRLGNERIDPRVIHYTHTTIMKIFFAIMLFCQVSLVFGSLDHEKNAPIDTVDNWQIYLDGKLLTHSNETALRFGFINTSIKLKVKRKNKELKIFFGGCYRGIPHHVEILDNQDKQLGVFHSTYEEDLNFEPVVIPIEFLEKHKGQKIILYELEGLEGKRKYLLAEIEIAE